MSVPPWRPIEDSVDVQTVAAAQAGDQRAFARLAVACGDRLHAIAYRILRDEALAEDASQNALLTIWRDLPQLRDPARFEAWAYRVLVRTCYAERRRIDRTPIRQLVWDRAAQGSDFERVADRDQLERAFRRLSVDHRAIVVLHHYLELPLEEVAATLEIPAGTVRSRLHHAMRSLRAALDADARTLSLEGSR